MANCHDLFQEFYAKISIDKSKRESLMSARDAIRNRIRKYFKEELEENVPLFYGQGSYSLNTIVNPLDGEYDIDDGVYLQNLDSDKDNWPTPETVHNWIYKAVENHTKEKPTDKRTCVRVNYSGHYHVDLPIYGEYEEVSYLAEKDDKGWHISEPKAFMDWFKDCIEKQGSQVRNLVKYIKAWADYKSSSVKLPCGFVLTILVTEEYEESERDDSAFAGTVRNVYDRILISSEILNPVDKSEDLGKRITDSQMDNFKEKLSKLLENAKDALKEEKKVDACKKWAKEFGDRFPNCDNIKEDEEPKRTEAPAILKDDARSA